MNAIISPFVQHCGEMGSRWGFNRTTGQMAALILCSPHPVTANELVERLNISRGNVSMGIKELVAWRLIKITHVPGERKEYYESAGSVWDLANRVIQERIKREIEPTLELLKENIDQPSPDDSTQYGQERMQEVYDLLSMTVNWTKELQSIEMEQMQTLMKLGSGVSRLLSTKDKILGKKSKKGEAA